MLTSQIKDLLNHLRSGDVDPASMGLFEQIAESEFVADLRESYSLTFQERSIGRKHEIGLARSVELAPQLRSPSESLFPVIQLLPVLRKCVLLSSYDGAISEVTVTTGIRIRPRQAAVGEFVLKMGRGFKLDRRPDGWSVRALDAKPTVLSEDFLRKRGWRFDAMLSARLQP